MAMEFFILVMGESFQVIGRMVNSMEKDVMRKSLSKEKVFGKMGRKFYASIN
jgi:hypothetical protein